MPRGYLDWLPSLAETKEAIVVAFETLLDLLDKLQTKPQVLEDRKKKKKYRHIAEFGHNVTPSLRLPDTPKKIKTACPLSNPNKDTTYLQLCAALLRKHPPLAPLPKPQYADDTPIYKKMIELEKIIQERKKTDKTAAIDDIEIQKIELVWEQIIEHAQRRADLFFYLLVAIYKQGITINKSDTLKQHGVGAIERNTNACHCSLFPNIKLDPIPSKWIPPVIAQFIPQKVPTLEHTHFNEVLNMTEELPRLVNEFDMYLEGKVHDPSNPVRTMTNILNKVSLGWWTPKQGMDEFYKRMTIFFDEFVKEGYKTIAEKTPNALMKVCELQREGTFKGATPDHNAMSEDYFYLLLRMTPQEITKAKWTPTFLTNYFYLESFYKQLQQDEIFKAPPVPRAKLSEADQRAKDIRDEAIKQKIALKKNNVVRKNPQIAQHKKSSGSQKDSTYCPSPSK